MMLLVYLETVLRLMLGMYMYTSESDQCVSEDIQLFAYSVCLG